MLSVQIVLKMSELAYLRGKNCRGCVKSLNTLTKNQLKYVNIDLLDKLGRDFQHFHHAKIFQPLRFSIYFHIMMFTYSYFMPT